MSRALLSSVVGLVLSLLTLIVSTIGAELLFARLPVVTLMCALFMLGSFIGLVFSVIGVCSAVADWIDDR